MEDGARKPIFLCVEKGLFQGPSEENGAGCKCEVRMARCRGVSWCRGVAHPQKT